MKESVETAAQEPVQILTPPSGFGQASSCGLPPESSAPPGPNSGGDHWRSVDQVDWQAAMKRAIRCSQQLRAMLGLAEEPNGMPAGAFPTFVPLEYLRRIRQGDPSDPLLRQVIESPQENVEKHGFVADPVGDNQSLAAGGLLHKYDGRALVITTGACGIHCRYCFRREFPYQGSGGQRDQWQPAVDYLANQTDISEVLLSGGDPLTLTDEKLFPMLDRLESIPHLQRLRFHSRMPVVIPQRITEALVSRLRGSRLAVWMVIHANHPRELDDAVLDRLSLLVRSGIPVLNQAVLLRGVNDDAETLIELCETLVNHQLMPYYLHQLDRVRGAAHFEVPVQQGRQLMETLRTSLPGYAVPKYVVEQAGEPSKTPLV